MRKLIGELRGEHTILLSTHILTEIEHTCDRILMMHRGRIAAVGTEEELEARLRSAEKLELAVRGDEAALKAALAGVAGTSELEVLTAELGGTPGVLSATLRVQSADVAEAVSRAVVSANLGLLALHPVRTGLEHVFLELSGAAASPSLPPQ